MAAAKIEKARAKTRAPHSKEVLHARGKSAAAFVAEIGSLLALSPS